MSRSSRQCFNLGYCLNTFTSIVQQVVTRITPSSSLKTLFFMFSSLPFVSSQASSVSEKVLVERLMQDAPPPYNSQMTIYKNSASRAVKAYVENLKVLGFQVQDNVQPSIALEPGLTVNCPSYFKWEISHSAQAWVSLFKTHLQSVEALCENLRKEGMQLTNEQVIWGVVIASMLNMVISDTKQRTKYLLKVILSVAMSGLTFLAGSRLVAFADVSLESYAIFGVSVASGLLSGYANRKLNQVIDYCCADQSEEYVMVPQEP